MALEFKETEELVQIEEEIKSPHKQMQCMILDWILLPIKLLYSQKVCAKKGRGRGKNNRSSNKGDHLVKGLRKASLEKMVGNKEWWHFTDAQEIEIQINKKAWAKWRRKNKISKIIEE